MMNRILERITGNTSVTLQESLTGHKRKTLHALLWSVTFIAIALLGIVLFLKFAASQSITIKDQQALILAGIATLIAVLIIVLLERHISYEVASLLFILLVIVGVFLGDTPVEVTLGRSLIFMILPVVLASVLLRPWAGLIVVAISCVFIIVVPLYLHLGLPNFPAILILILIALILQQSTSNLELAMKKSEQTKQILREKEERFRALIESSTDINAILSQDGIVKYASPSVERVLGYKVEDLIGHNIFEYIHPEDGGISAAALGSRIPAEAIGPMLILRLRHKNGSWISLETTGKEMFHHPDIMGTVVNCRDITEHKRIETDLRESEEKFAKAFRLSPTSMAISEPDGKFLEINRAFTQTLGYKPEEVIGRTPNQVNLLLDPEQNQKAIQILKEKGYLRDFELVVRTRSGRLLQGVLFAEPLQIESHPLVLTLMNDVTERKQVYEALRDSEEKYRRLIEMLPIGVIVHQEGQIHLINPAGAKIMGAVTPEKLVGTPILDLFHPDSREVVRTRIQESLSKGVNTELQIEKLIRIDGTSFDAEVIALPIILGGKESMFVVFADITERKQAEEALKKSEENFRNLSENTADGILIVTHDGRHVYANRHACELSRYAPEEMVQTSLIDLADPAAYPQLQQRLLDRLAGRPVPGTYETIIRRKDGTSFPADITATRTVWQDQSCDLVLFRDITERKQAQEAISAQNQLIQEVSRQLVDVQEREKHLLATELHDDLGQSLTSLKLMLELATSKRAANQQNKVLGSALELVSELIGKVRNLSQELRPAMLDDFGLFVALRWLFERFHSQTGITVQSNCNSDSDRRFPQPIETAAFRIIQEALTNIARHAEVHEAQVNLSIGENLLIEVADKGTGFEFADGNKKTTVSGGLSGMQERARLLGGRVEIHSEKGAGTRVIATIPLAGDAR